MSNRRALSSPPPRIQAPASGPSFRIRHALLLVLVVLAGMQLAPRVRAYFHLHDLATAVADYGLCMAGPTGPAALRDNPSHYAELVRRRLITASAESTPFSECMQLAASVRPEQDFVQAHGVPAGDFLEFGLRKDGRATLSQLQLGLGVLADAAKAAWPFEQTGYTRLVRPSSHAKEAAHPVELNPPAVGRGLPGWRATHRSTWSHGHSLYAAFGRSANLSVYESVDGGLSWHRTALDRPGVPQHAGRCVQSGSPQSFVVAVEPQGLAVQSLFGDNLISEVRAEGSFEVLGTACDDHHLLLATETAGTRSVQVCAHAGTCAPVPVEAEWLAGHFDIARLHGISVVATARGGIVRVRSSRDNGQSWTPATVAFDWASAAAKADVPIPSRLLGLGDRLVLYGAARDEQSYPVLISDDIGASWRTPVASEAPAAPRHAGR